MNPAVRIVRVADTYIYLKNMLRWGKDNPELKEALEMPFDQMVADIDRVVDGFRPIFDTHIDRIVSCISDRSGFTWPKDPGCIQIYPIPFFNSFSHPLFLRVCSIVKGKIVARPHGLVLGLVIHELCHNNWGNLSIDRDLNETLIHFIVRGILDSINPSYTEEYLKFHERIGKGVDFSAVPEPIVSGKATVARFFSER